MNPNTKALIPTLLCHISLLAQTNLNPCQYFFTHPQRLQIHQSVANKWHISTGTQLAVLLQESNLSAYARADQRHWINRIFSTKKISAYGYAQAIDRTWGQYQQTQNKQFASRHNYHDATDFIGWYLSTISKQTHIPTTQTEKLYLAYHEGIKGYQKQTYKNKPQLQKISHKVAQQGQAIDQAIDQCQYQLRWKLKWFKYK